MNGASIFDDELDLSGFQPKPPAPAKDVRQVAGEGGLYQPRASGHPEPPQPVRREQRRYRTGRNIQLNLKVTQGAIDEFYRLADQEEIVLGEAFCPGCGGLESVTTGKLVGSYHSALGYLVRLCCRSCLGFPL